MEQEIQKRLQSKMREAYRNICGGLTNHGSSELKELCIGRLYITEGGSGEVSNEHKVKQVEMAAWRPGAQEMPITSSDIFTFVGQNGTIRTVLTKGIAGIGKTVCVHKFILDWADEEANQDIGLIFPIPFRELNLMKDKNLSLMDLLSCFFREKVELADIIGCKVMFIFDGLDEYRLPLDFKNTKTLCDETESASVDVLLTNLIKGNLCPSALLWITSRPAAANQIPPECVDLVTNVRGFSDSQKEEYFRKRIGDQYLVKRVITHVKSSRSLSNMCHIPVFCQILATVLERTLAEAESGEIPNTLTQIFLHFLILNYEKCQTDPCKTRAHILELSMLALQQLEEDDLVICEDLQKGAADDGEVSDFSGVFCQIFRLDIGLHWKKVHRFVHISVQQFLAALCIFLSFVSKETKVLKHQQQITKQFLFYREIAENKSVNDFLKAVVDKSLCSEKGYLDHLLHFLLGLSLDSSQVLLQDLLGQKMSPSHSSKEIIEYIKEKIMQNPSPNTSISLFHCLMELNDNSFIQDVQMYLEGEERDECLGGGRAVAFSPAHWCALVFLLLHSQEQLEEFHLRKYGRSDESCLRLLPVIKASRKADLWDCKLTLQSFVALASVLSSDSSSLQELVLDNNDLHDSGAKLLSAGLQNPHCKLKALSLSFCSIPEEGCATLASALKSNPSYLRELDLGGNKPGDSGVKELCALLKDARCRLKNLQLYACCIPEEGCAALVSALRSNPSYLRELSLSRNEPGDSGMKLVSALLEDPQCGMETLVLIDCGITEEGCAVLASALRTNPSHIRDLNLNCNKPGDSGVKLLSALLEDSRCKLETLELYNCGVSEVGCVALASALRSNPSHLRQLILGYNEPGDSGVKMLSALLQDPQCRLENLDLEMPQS